ncbi:MAG: hypothetical protein VB055_06275 [Oscillospiraceae bacterium]|nr:hypothetical protein [Oscillospiraceae bacterium]
MTEQQLLSLYNKIGPEQAARYLQNGTTAQQVRVWAQSGYCPFCQAVRLQTFSRRLTYRIHIGNLIAYKSGERTEPMPQVGYGEVVCRA